MNCPKKNLTVLAALASFAVFPLAQHASAQVVPPESAPWETTAAAGFTLTQGNSDTLLVTASILGVKKWDQNEVRLGANGTYGETENVRNNETIQGFGQYNRLLSDRVYGFVRLEGMRDAIADVDYRFILSAGAGYYFIRSDKTSLSVEVGPGFVHERQGDDSNSYLTLRVAERFEHKLSDTAKVWQSLEIIPEVGDWDNFIATAEIGIEAGLTEKLSLRSYLVNIYDNEPAPGRKENDLKLVTALAYTF